MIDEMKLLEELKQSGMIADNAYGNAVADMINGQPRTGNWIPCSERLPEPEEEIEISVKRVTETGTYHFSVRGFYEDGTVWNSDSAYMWDFPEDVPEWNSSGDDFKVPESWWEQSSYAEETIHCIDDHVLAWRPLAEPYRDMQQEG